MPNWKEYKLENVINVKHGFAFKGAFISKDPSTDILLTPGNFNIGGGFKTDKFKYYTGSYPEDYILKEGDIIVTMTDLSKEGDTLGYSAKIPAHNGIKYLHNQRLGLLRLVNEEFNKDFIYWLLRTREYQQFIVSSATGTTVKHTSPTRICEYNFKAPDYNTQTTIAEILSSLDDKIELNNKINQELENLAQTLFKQWFIDFEFPNENGEPYKSSGGEMVDSELGEIPKGWEVKRIDELDLYISDLVANGSFASIKENVQTTDIEDYALFIRNTDLKNRFKAQKLFVNKHSYDFLKKTELSGGEIILPNVGDVGSVHRCPKFDIPMTLGNNCIMVKSDFMQNWLFTFFRSLVGYHSLRSVVVGSVQDKLSKTNFKSIRIVVPDAETLQITENALKSIYDLQESNLKESDEFEILRDTLLPKLISGELEVPDVMTEKA
jgi:type I restriction enzyme S subunit